MYAFLKSTLNLKCSLPFTHNSGRSQLWLILFKGRFINRLYFGFYTFDLSSPMLILFFSQNILSKLRKNNNFPTFSVSVFLVSFRDKNNTGSARQDTYLPIRNKLKVGEMTVFVVGDHNHFER